MNISEEGKDFIKHKEGLMQSAYRDIAGVLTIGYGHTGPDVYPDSVWTPGQSDVAFEKDIQKVVNCINGLVVVDLSQNQFDALCSFVFNLGCRAFGNSTLLSKLNAGDYTGAAKEFEKWCHSGPKVIDGLLARRKAESNLFMSGTDTQLA